MKLLLAEDEVELSNALCAILKHAGYSVDDGRNGCTENAAHGGKDYAGAFSDGAAGSERPGQRT